MNLGGFSWRRLVGITAFKSRISRTIGIPLTASGRRRKLGATIFNAVGPVVGTAAVAAAGLASLKQETHKAKMASPPDHPHVSRGVYFCQVKGITHDNADGSSRRELVKLCSVGDPVQLIPEPDNPHDRNAIRVLLQNGRQIGYISRRQAERFCGMMSQLTATVHSHITDEWGNSTVKLRVVDTAEQQQSRGGTMAPSAPATPDVSAIQAEARETATKEGWGSVLIYFESADAKLYRVMRTTDTDFIHQSIQEGMVRIGWIGMTDAPTGGINFDFSIHDSFPLGGDTAKRFAVNAQAWAIDECKRQCAKNGLTPPVVHDLQPSKEFVAAQNAATLKPVSAGWTARWKLLIVLGLLILVGMIINRSIGTGGGSASSTPVPPIVQEKDQLDAIIGSCGKPDVDNSTEYNNPRPSSPTRWLVYKQAHIKITFLAKGDGGLLPTHKWQLVRMTDSRTKQPLTPQEAFKRMSCLPAP